MGILIAFQLLSFNNTGELFQLKGGSYSPAAVSFYNKLSLVVLFLLVVMAIYIAG
jgi:hypothetical protein